MNMVITTQEHAESTDDLWMQWLSPDLQEAVHQARALQAQARQYRDVADQALQVHDFAYLVFPMAIVYEGFLKQYLLKIGLIDKKAYNSRRFRIGRSLNPDIRQHQRDDKWLYDDVAHACGEGIARELWDTWLECRNRVFHYFPERHNTLDFDGALASVRKIENAMREAVACQL